MYKKLKSDERGSITPFIVSILLLCILVGIINLSLTIIYKNRTIVRDALDAACTSALAGASEERCKATLYAESIESFSFDEENVSINIKYEPYKSLNKNYIYLDTNKAKDIFIEIFDKNLKMNMTDYNINNYNVSFEYDGKNIEKVTKERKETLSAPDLTSWWKSEFEKDDIYIKDYYSPPDWSEYVSYESRDVIFPRWVKIKANVELKIDVPLVKLINSIKTTKDDTDVKKSLNINYNAEVVKELQSELIEKEKE